MTKIKSDWQRVTYRPCTTEPGDGSISGRMKMGEPETVVLQGVKIGRGWVSGRSYHTIKGSDVERFNYIDTDCVLGREQQYVDPTSGTISYRKIRNSNTVRVDSTAD